MLWGVYLFNRHKFNLFHFCLLFIRSISPLLTLTPHFVPDLLSILPAVTIGFPLLILSADPATCPHSCSSFIVRLIICRGQIIYVASVLQVILLLPSGLVYLVWLSSGQLETVLPAPVLPPSSHHIMSLIIYMSLLARFNPIDTLHYVNTRLPSHYCYYSWRVRWGEVPPVSYEMVYETYHLYNVCRYWQVLNGSL